MEYKVAGNYSRDTAIIIGYAYRKGSEWMFWASGKGSRATDLLQLARECTKLWQ